MTMTHYMELLATNQPWNLIIFMVIPVLLAETIAISELYLLFTRDLKSSIRTLNQIAGIVVGIYFIGIIYYLFGHAVVPLSAQDLWRGPADIIAVGTYMMSGVPLFLIALLELKLIWKKNTIEQKLKIHAILVGIFLLFAHIAMIFGMVNPEVMGYQTQQKTPQMMDMKM